MMTKACNQKMAEKEAELATEHEKSKANAINLVKDEM
jgi:hypothetical protein